MSVGYSGTPLAKKLGIKEGLTVMVFNAPSNYLELVDPLPPNVRLIDDNAPPRSEDEISTGVDLMHLFTNHRDELFGLLSESMRHLKKNGAFWGSWYKKAAKLPTEITETPSRSRISARPGRCQGMCG